MSWVSLNGCAQANPGANHPVRKHHCLRYPVSFQTKAMAEASSSGFKWKLTRDVAFDIWQLQFKAFMDTKGCLKWLTTVPDSSKEQEKAADATAKSQIILAMKDASLIRLSSTSGVSAKEYWDALVLDFEGRMRIRKHEIVREERVFAQKRAEAFVDYCDRAADLQARMVTAGIDTGCLVDNVILGLAEPFQRNNREQLTKLAHDSGHINALAAVLSYIRQYSRLNPKPDGAADGVALAATGRRKFTGICHYCHIKGHLVRDCRKKKADERAGRPQPTPRGGGTPQSHATPLFCEGSCVTRRALAASHSWENTLVLERRTLLPFLETSIPTRS